MGSKLILYKPELNPDVYFENPPVSFWNFGTGWTFGTNNTNGLGAEKLGVASSNLTLYLNDGNFNITDQVLLPYTDYKYKVRAEFVTNAGGGDYCRLVIGGSTILTHPASGSDAIYEGTFTTGATGTVQFQSTSGNSVLLSYLNLTENPSEYDIDLTDEIDVPLTFAIADIVDPDKRDGSFSKTVRIPGTKANNQFFAHIYEISGSDKFNVNKKVRCEVFTDGIPQFSGFAKLDHINRINNGTNNYDEITYDITLYGDLGDFFFTLGDTMLNELDFSEFDHVYSKANQFNSWYTSIIRNGATYSHVTNGSYLTVSSSQNNGGRVQMNFSAAHGLVAGDWVLFPENSITSGTNGYYYLGEHMVYSVVSATAVVLQCPFYAPAGSITTASVGTDRVRKHSKTGEGYVYPMIDYDQNNGALWYVNQFYPCLFVKQIIDKIFKKAKYTYDSDIFDSVIFKKMIVQSMGGLKLTPEQILERLFLARNTNNQFNTFNLTQSGNVWTYTGTGITALDVQIDDDSTAPMFDNNGVFNTGTYRYTCSNTGIYSLNFAGILRFGNTGTETFNAPLQNPIFQLEVYDYTAGQTVPSCVVQFSPSTIYPTSSNSSQYFVDTVINNCYLTSGNAYGIRMRIINAGTSLWIGAGTNVQIQWGVFGTTCFFGNKIVNANLQAGDTVYMNSILPKMKCTEFMGNIIRMFNLYLTNDKMTERKLFIETRDNFYDNGDEIDWTSKLDISQNIKQTPMASLQGKFISYNFSEDNDFYNKDHKAKYDWIYGNLQKRFDNDFKKNEYSINVSFAPTILTDLYGKVVSNMQASTDTDNSNDAFTGKLRIMYFNCASQNPFYAWNVKTDQSDTLGTTHTMYPYAGHLDKPDAPYHDLNFWYPRGVYFNYDAWTDRNLFNLYHKRSHLEQTDPEGRMVQCYMHLTAKDIFTLDFRNRFKIDEHIFRLNKIIDFNVGKNVPVLCEFIKAFDIPEFTSEIDYDIEIGVGWVAEGFDFGLPGYIGEGNGYNQGAGNKVIINGSSQVGAYSYNVLVSGDGNYVGNSSSDITIVGGANNKIAANSEGITLIDCVGLELGVDDSGKTFIQNERVISSAWVSVNSSASPVYVNGDDGDKYDVDVSLGDLTFIIDFDAIGSNDITFKVSAVGNNIIFTTPDASETFDGNALPYTITPLIYESYTISRKGTKIGII